VSPRERGLGEQRDLQRQLRAVLVAQLQRGHARHVAACGVTADRNLRWVHPLLGGMVKQPADEVLDLLDLQWILRLWS
jgi:hypothetical protein